MTAPFADPFRSPGDVRNVLSPERQLWASVLTVLIEDAINGAPSIMGKPHTRQRLTAEARAYFLDPSPSLAVICELLDLNPVAVRERVVTMIEAEEHGETPTHERATRARQSSDVKKQRPELAE